MNRAAYPLYQYDYGQTLVLTNVTLPETYEVHFSNAPEGNSKTSLGNADGVAIPDEFLTSGETVYVWLFLHDGNADGETEYRGIIHVYKRAKPTNDPPTPQQQDVISQLIDRMDTAVEESEAAADRAEAVVETIDELINERLAGKADKVNPEFDGSISLDRRIGSHVGNRSIAIGTDNTASAGYSYAVGVQNTASGEASHAEGGGNTASGMQSHAEGESTTARVSYAQSEGKLTTASGNNSHSEGIDTTASNTNSHSEGRGTVADGGNSHAEGEYCQALKNASHAEGGSTVSAKKYSHAEGNQTRTTGMQSHAEGLGTIANHASQHVFGEYNVEDQNEADDESRGDFVEIVGNGTENARSNARTLDWDGNERLAGNLYVNGDQQVCSEGDIATTAETQAIIDEFVR